MHNAPLVNIPTHVIAGPLGSGKTSLIRHLLSQRPPSERWAVLINEFGQVGIDAALLETREDDVTIAEIPGGCLCCVNGVPFQVGLTRLLRRARPDRLLIEASGLGHPGPLIRQLAQAPWNTVLHVHPLTVVVDASALAAGTALPISQVEALDLAGLVVMNKSEALDAPARERACAYLGSTPHAWCQHGQLPWASLTTTEGTPSNPELAHSETHGFDQAAPEAAEPRRLWLSPEQWQRKVQTTDSGHSIGWLMSPAVCFDRAALERWLRTLVWQRAKGVLRTTEGWLGFNAVAGASVEWRQHSPRSDNRVELITELPPNPQALEAGLRETVDCG